MTKPGTNSPAANTTTSAGVRSAPPSPPPARRDRPAPPRQAPSRPAPPRQAPSRPAQSRPAPRRPWSKSQEKLALLYNEQGRRPEEIADKLGLSTYLVTQIILTSRNRGKL